MTVLIIITSGLAVWFFQGGGSVTVGASGLVFGYFGYVVARGLIDRNLVDALVAVVLALSFAYLLTRGHSWHTARELDRPPGRPRRRRCRRLALPQQERGKSRGRSTRQGRPRGAPRSGKTLGLRRWRRDTATACRRGQPTGGPAQGTRRTGPLGSRGEKGFARRSRPLSGHPSATGATGAKRKGDRSCSVTWCCSPGRPKRRQEQRRTVAAELRKLPGLIAELRGYDVGPDAGINQGNYDFAVVADFDDRAGYLAYRNHPAHRAVVDKHITPIVSHPRRGPVRDRHGPSRSAASRPPRAAAGVPGNRPSERVFWKLHEIEAGLLGDLPFRGKPGQHGRGEEPGGGDLARVEGRSVLRPQCEPGPRTAARMSRRRAVRLPAPSRRARAISACRASSHPMIRSPMPSAGGWH